MTQPPGAPGPAPQGDPFWNNNQGDPFRNNQAGPPPPQGPPAWQAAPQLPVPQPPKRGAAKWILGGTALLAVIGVTVAVTVAVAGRDTAPAAGPGTVTQADAPRVPLTSPASVIPAS